MWEEPRADDDDNDDDDSNDDMRIICLVANQHPPTAIVVVNRHVPLVCRSNGNSRNENGRCKIKTLLDRKWRKTIKRKIMHNSISVARVMHTTFSFGIEHHNHNTDSVVPFELFAEYLFPSERKTTRHLVKRWLSSVFFFRFCFSSVPYLFHIRWRTGSAVGILNGIVDASMLWDFRFNSSCVCRSILLPVSSTWHYNDPTTTRSFRFVWDCRLWYGKLCSRYPWCVGGVTAFPPHSAHFA